MPTWAIWCLAAYSVVGLLWAGFVAFFAATQGDPIGWGETAWHALTWPWQLRFLLK